MMARVCTLVVLLFVLFCHAKGETCTPIEGQCGCRLTNNLTSADVLLDFTGADEYTTPEPGNANVTYQYGVCSALDDAVCNDGKTVMCRLTGEGQTLTGDAIGILDNVTYTVNSLSPLNISSLYSSGNSSNATATVYLVCGEDATNASFSFQFSANDNYYFELRSSNFCVVLPAVSTEILLSTAMMLSSVPAGTLQPASTTMIPTVPVSTLQPPASTHVMPTTPANTLQPARTTVIPTVPAGTLEPVRTTLIPPTTTLQPSLTPTKPTSSTSPVKPSKAPENKDDKDRKIALGIILSIVGAIILAVVAAIVVYFVWWRKHRASKYERIPSM